MVTTKMEKKFKLQDGWDGQNEFDGFVLIEYTPDPENDAGMVRKKETYYETYNGLPRVGKALSWYNHIKWIADGNGGCDPDKVAESLVHPKKMFFEQISGIEHLIPREIEFVRQVSAEQIAHEVSDRTKWLLEVN